MSQDSRNYYDEQFGKRISEIAKPGATPPPASGSSGSGWGMRSGFGILGGIVLLVIRLAVFSGSSSTYSPPTYQYTPPPTFTVPQQHIDFEPDQKRWNEERKNNDWKKQLGEPKAKDQDW